MIMIKPQSSFASCLRHPSICHNFIFLLLTALMLWVPIQFRETLPFWQFERIAIFILALLLTIRYYLSLDETKRRFNLLSYGIMLYGLWVVISSGMHYWAINSSGIGEYPFSSNLPSIRSDSRWLIWCLVHYTVIHLFFISFLLVSIVIFRFAENQWKKLTWIPLIFIPCLLVGLYQIYIDPDFLNNRPFGHPDQDLIGGLGTDLTAFRSSLFLVFPLCIFALVTVQAWRTKILYILIAAVILWLMWLSEGRGIIAATLLFAAVFPIIGTWVHGFHSDSGRRYLYAGLVWILALVLLAGFTTVKFTGSKIISRQNRVTVAFNRIFKGEFAKVDPFRNERIRYEWRMVKLSPIAGLGPGGFLRNIDKLRFVSRDPLINEDPFPREHYQYGTNQYLEWFNDAGLLGASVILFLYVMPLWMIIRVRKRIQNREERWAVGIIFLTLAIMFLLLNMIPYANFPDVQWIFVVYLGFLISLALKHGYTIYPIKDWRWSVGALFLTVIFFIGVYGTAFGSRGYKAIYEEALFHPASRWENQAEGKKTNAIETSIHKIEATSDIFCITTSTVGKNNLLVDGVKLKIFVNDELIDIRHIFKSSENTLHYNIAGMKGRIVEIRTEVYPVFKVYQSLDKHIQMTVGPPSFIDTIPEEGIGFYSWAKSKIGHRFYPGLPAAEVIVDARWTGMRATLNVTESLRNKGFIYLQSGNPYQNRKPVCVDIIGDQGFIERVWFWNGHWKKIHLVPDQLSKTKTLTFKVNQTWNPSLFKFSADSRDLGIVVALPEFDEGRFFLFEHLQPMRGES